LSALWLVVKIIEAILHSVGNDIKKIKSKCLPYKEEDYENFEWRFSKKGLKNVKREVVQIESKPNNREKAEKKVVSQTFYDLVMTPEERQELIEIAEGYSSAVNKLKKYERIDLSSPKENDCVIYLPVEGKNDINFFVRMYLLRNHIVERIIISQFGYMQYQIPVRADNEELILLVFGKHFFNGAINVDIENPIGISLCEDVRDKVEDWSPVAKYSERMKEFLARDSSRSQIITQSKEYKKFEQAREKYEKWESDALGKTKESYERSPYKVYWTKEHRLYCFAKLYYPDAVFHYSADWLELQTLDIYIPSIQTGIEYQGKQHFEAIDYFGGENALVANTERDTIKRNKCNENNIRLIEFNYDTRVDYKNVSTALNKGLFDTDIALYNCKPFPVKELLGVGYNELKDSEKSASPKNAPKKAEKKIPDTVIRKYSETGEYLGEFRTIEEAASASGVSYSSIYKCLSGERRKAANYYWAREDYSDSPRGVRIVEEDTMKESMSGLPKAVLQIDPDTGEVLNRYNSISEAAHAVKVNTKGISSALSGRQKTSAGFIWTLDKTEE